MQIGELTRRLGIPNREVRYVLEQGLLPPGVELNPGRGEHRQLDPKQAFWLGLLLLLKRNGLRAPLAAKIAEDLRVSVRGIASNAGWDWTFNPFIGRFDTEHTWFADIGDLRFVRIVTNAHPSRRNLFEFPWSVIGTRNTIDAQPLVVIRVDLGHLAQLIRKSGKKQI